MAVIAPISELIGNIAWLLFGIGFLILARPLGALLSRLSQREPRRTFDALVSVARHIASMDAPPAKMLNPPESPDEPGP